MICLNMIVKDEAESISRCLESVKPFIDYYLIADTGSTDNTIDIIRQTMKGMPGEVLAHEWVNFGYNREKALRCAYDKPEIDYCLFIDADEELIIEDEAAFKDLTADSYFIEKVYGAIRYSVPALVNIKKSDWHWKGVVHNYLSGNGKVEKLAGVTILHYSSDGGKSHGLSRTEKFITDARLLEDELKKHPDDARSMFYLAQSYRDAGKFNLAYESYIKRVKMGGWAEEVYVSMIQAAAIKQTVTKGFPLAAFLDAFNYRPTRPEAIYGVARFYRLNKKHSLAYIFAKIGCSIPASNDVLFVDRDIEDWKMADELAIAAYWTGNYKECESLCNMLLSGGKLPDREVARVTKNKDFAISKMGQGANYYDDLHRQTIISNGRYARIYEKIGCWASGKVLDIGCGTAELSKHIKDYTGFDFSKEAISRAVSNNVHQANAYGYDYAGYDTFVAVEVLEHLDDIEVIGSIPSGKTIIFSVPSFTDTTHLRTYTEDSIKTRFNKLVDINKMVRFNYRNGQWVEGGNETNNHILLVKGIRK